jgi:GPH family glycoside/pentoside/hexuronide:cation symporter
LAFHTKFWFGFGQAAEGMTNAAFNAFLLLYYCQVLGLPAHLGGAALFVALAIDAVTDPMTGSISDAMRHRWGRRHPFMYAAALPMWVTFALVFNPPSGLGTTGLFLWMLSFTVLTRIAMTLYHVPHLALGAELSSNYDERTTIVAWRNFFALSGAAMLFLVCRQWLMLPTEEFPNGQLNPASYPPMGMFFGIAIGVAILFSAAGTHSRIPTLRGPSHREPFSFRRLARELAEAMNNSSFRSLFIGVLVLFISRGVASTLDIYMGTFFWGLETDRVLLMPLAAMFGVAIGTPFWAIASRGREKCRLFMMGLLWFSTLTFLLPFLKIVGLYFPSESALYLPGILSIIFAAAVGASAPLVLVGSMMADLADEHELETGRRQEGILFGALSFSYKAAVGAGSGLAGLALSAIAWPQQVEPSQVPAEKILALGLIAGPGIAVFMAIGALMMYRYKLTKERVADIQLQLSVRANGTTAR